VAAPGSHRHKHLLQDTHRRVAPSWAPRCIPKSTPSSLKCQAPVAGGEFPPCLLPPDMVQHQQTPPQDIYLQGWQLTASRVSSNTALIPPWKLPSSCRGSATGRWSTCPPQQAETSPAHQPRGVKPEPSFYPKAQSPIPSACPAGVSGGITMEQLLIDLSLSQCCLMAASVMAGVFRGCGVPSGAGPSEALSFLPLVAPSWDFPLLAGEEPPGRPFRTMNFSVAHLAANIFPSGFVQVD